MASATEAQLDLPRSAVDPETARRAVADVLDGAAYVREPPTLAELLWRALLEGIGRLYDLFATADPRGLLSTAALVVFGLGLLVVLGRFARGTRGDPAARREPLASDRGRPASAWRVDAEAAEADGRWGDAVRCRWRAAIVELADAGVLEERPGRTARELLVAAADAAPAVTAPLEELTSRFERWVYGSVADGADADAARAAEAGVRTALGRRGRAVEAVVAAAAT